MEGGFVGPRRRATSLVALWVAVRWPIATAITITMAIAVAITITMTIPTTMTVGGLAVRGRRALEVCHFQAVVSLPSFVRHRGRRSPAKGTQAWRRGYSKRLWLVSGGLGSKA